MSQEDDVFTEDPKVYYLRISICIAYGILCAVGTFGNLCVIIMIVHIFYTQSASSRRRSSVSRVCAPTSSMRHVFVYVLALCIVDLMVALHLPFLIVDSWFRRWVFGPFMCKLYMMGECINKTASTFILTVLSWDRYMAVCEPIASLRFRKPSVSLAIVLGCCVLAAGILSPIEIYAAQREVYNTNETIGNRTVLVPGYKCAFDPGPWFFWMTFTVGFCIPGLLMIIFYSCVMCRLQRSSKAVSKWNSQLHTAHQPRMKQVTVRILAVIVFYFVCWTPHWLLNLLLIADWLRVEIDRYWTVVLFYGAHVLVCCNSAINPFFYALLNRELRAQHLAAMEKRRQSWYNATSHALGFLGRHGARLTSDDKKKESSVRSKNSIEERNELTVLDVHRERPGSTRSDNSCYWV